MCALSTTPYQKGYFPSAFSNTWEKKEENCHKQFIRKKWGIKRIALRKAVSSFFYVFFSLCSNTISLPLSRSKTTELIGWRLWGDGNGNQRNAMGEGEKPDMQMRTGQRPIKKTRANVPCTFAVSTW